MIKKWQREECDGKNISTNPAKGGTDGKQERGVQEEATNMMGDLEKLRKNKRERERKVELVFSFFLCVPQETNFLSIQVFNHVVFTSNHLSNIPLWNFIPS